MGLTCSGVGILSEDDDFNLVERRVVEGIEDQGPRGVNHNTAAFFLQQEFLELDEIIFLKLFAEAAP